MGSRDAFAALKLACRDLQVRVEKSFALLESVVNDKANKVDVLQNDALEAFHLILSEKADKADVPSHDALRTLQRILDEKANKADVPTNADLGVLEAVVQGKY